MSTLLRGIGELVTNDPALGHGPLGTRTDAAIVLADGMVGWVGSSDEAPPCDRVVDVGGRSVVPGFVDSHAHLVFAGDRTAEFDDRMSGRPYQAAGILTTVAATRAASDEALTGNASRLLGEMLDSGSTTVEIKSGYGLTVADEERSVKVAATQTEDVTYLGAHVIPPEYADDRPGYLDLLTGPMLDACAPHARWVDVFCDSGAFDVDESRAVLAAGAARGLGRRVHANQLGPGQGVRLAVEVDAASADHCTHLDDADVDALAGSRTVATLLPGAEFSTRSPYPDARRLLDAGATVALATDCNPGSSYTTSMPFCMALAVREMRMTPAEALWSSTAGGAAALRRADVGRLTQGTTADLVVLDAPSYVHLAYRPGVDVVHQVWMDGELAVPRR